MRRIFLWAARNRWLKERLPDLPVHAACRPPVHARRDDGVRAGCRRARSRPAGIATMYTRLGENLSSLDEADEVADHYIAVLDAIKARGIDGEVSVKPTQLGLDHDEDATLAHLVRIAEHAAATGSYLWIDMEGSAYAEPTIRLYERLRAVQPRDGHLPAGVPQAHRRATSPG